MHQRIKCDQCGQEICNIFILKRHKASVHGITPSDAFQCEYCPAFFEHMKAKDKHLAKHHVEKLQEISALTNTSELNENKDTIVTGLQVQYRLKCSPDPTTIPNCLSTISMSKLEKIYENELQNSLLHPVKRQKDKNYLTNMYFFTNSTIHI